MHGICIPLVFPAPEYILTSLTSSAWMLERGLQVGNNCCVGAMCRLRDEFVEDDSSIHAPYNQPVGCHSLAYPFLARYRDRGAQNHLAQCWKKGQERQRPLFAWLCAVAYAVEQGAGTQRKDVAVASGARRHLAHRRLFGGGGWVLVHLARGR